ncbi:polyphosphate kinase 1 [Niastella koreensis]|uniref:Polyphosphate kinase n=2 Tax=Niastella koreensis TaxID=354356 RepID=G8TBG6_NIAKG|nr:polyphosphate kinase 1 [Niastella koreensis]AEW03466.1 polyphosphate kinase 1 [Niastella koreensis GR20-10]OQP53830.1 polyphosphate kinase 1 [Niastella koreensis]
MQSEFFDRDLSWLAFNGRVLEEAGSEHVPLLERIRFLSIYSSNLDEFYRVRMPAVMALEKLQAKGDEEIAEHVKRDVLLQIIEIINQQQERFGAILTTGLLPLLKEKGIHLLYNEPIPADISTEVSDYFYTQVMAFLQPVFLSVSGIKFFPENNKIYLLVVIEGEKGFDELVIINIPSDNLPRFYTVKKENEQIVIFLDDIIKYNLSAIFKHTFVKGCYSFKITRDAELEVADDYAGDIARKIEEQLTKRDFGLATRLLHEPGLEHEHLRLLTIALKLQHAMIVQGGHYHNLKDLGSFPSNNTAISYERWPAIPLKVGEGAFSLFEEVEKKDLMLHPPYQSYDMVLRFFNEAAVDPAVTEIYVTLYRIASDSRIGNALVSAAKNGKKVSVLVELKARFDEANNIRWAKKMKTAGVKIIYSPASLKVHAKIALVKRRKENRISYVGLLATGNMNESTARFYTDHILFTAHPEILREMELLFIFLGHRKKTGNPGLINFNYLLVAQFNLQQRFLQLIDREIEHARAGKEAAITIKMNNLEEKVLINKLYEASQAGVKVRMIVRSICCLKPGVPGLSEHIIVTRIVDRYLEHGRIFVFHNNGTPELYMGSSDWMNRNIYRRIEVCFPVFDSAIKKQVLEMLQLQLQDNGQAVQIDPQLNNVPLPKEGGLVYSQQAIYNYLAKGQG